MKTKQIQTSRDIIKELARQSGSSSMLDTFSRYIFILNNHLNGYPLSRIESKHKENNRPRKYYIDILIKGCKLDIDLSSPLFEDSIDTEHNAYGSSDDSFFYKRFFERLFILKKLGYEFNKSTIHDAILLGDVLFKHDYFLIDPIQSNAIQKRISEIKTKLRLSDGMFLSYLGITELTLEKWTLSNKDPKVGKLNLLYEVIQRLYQINPDPNLLRNFLINERIVFDENDYEDGSFSILNYLLVNYIDLINNDSNTNEIISKYKKCLVEVLNEK
jgi:hypothetical protein